MIPDPDDVDADVYELVTNDPALAAVYQYLLSGGEVVQTPLAGGMVLIDPPLYIDEDVLRGDR